MTIIREARYEDMRQIISGVENVWVLVLGIVLFAIFVSLGFRQMAGVTNFGYSYSQRQKHKRLAYIYTALGIMAITTSIVHSYILPALDTEGYYLARIESMQEFDTHMYEIVDIAGGDNYWVREVE